MKNSSNTHAWLSSLILGGALLSNTAQATDELYLSPQLSYIKTDSDRKADNDLGLMLGLGKELNKDWNIEANIVFDDLDFEASSGAYKQRGIMIDGLYFFDRSKSLQIYGVIGAGVMTTDTGVSDTTNPMLNIGVGLMHQITEGGIKLRADMRYRLDMDDESVVAEDEFNDLMFNIGLSIPFGGKQQSASNRVYSSTAVISDSDSDGINDTNDLCPGSRSGATVNKKGCEVNVENVSTSTASREAGSTDEINVQDGDVDGITDDLDKCLNTISGAKVDAKGCELKQSFVLQGVTFLTGSNVLKNEAMGVLTDVATTLKKHPELNVELAGYTDDRGNADFNQRLSESRAESVKKYLQLQGVNSDQVVAKGYGETSPIADNQTAQGRARNRRVELHILK